MLLAKQSTAMTVIVGPILDSAGAEYASAVIGDMSISKNGGTLTAMAAAASLTYIANGMYTLVLTTGNLDTVGTAEISCNKSTYQMRQKEFQVVEEAIYDAMYAASATGLLPANVTQLLGSAAGLQTICTWTGTLTGTPTTLVMDLSSGPGKLGSLTNSYIVLTSGDNIGQCKRIIACTAGNQITVFPAFTDMPGADTYAIIPFARVDSGAIAGQGQTPGDVYSYLTTNLGTAGAAATALATQASADVIDANVDLILGDTGTDGVVLSAATCAKIADIILRRAQASVEASGDGDAISLGCLYGLIQQAQESNAVDSPGNLTVYKTDGVTSLGTKALDTDAAADPVVGVS